MNAMLKRASPRWRAPLAQVNTRRRELTEREPLWLELDAQVRRLGETMSLDVVDRSTLERARVSPARNSRQRGFARKNSRARANDRTRRHASCSGGPFEPELLRLKAQLAADLLTMRFEDAGIEESGLLEARLGSARPGVGGHGQSKAILTEAMRSALGMTEAAHDGAVRLRPSAGLVAHIRRGDVDLTAVASVLGEVSIPEQAFLHGRPSARGIAQGRAARREPRRVA